MAKPTYSFEFTPARSTAGSSHDNVLAMGSNNNRIHAIEKASFLQPEKCTAYLNKNDVEVGCNEDGEEGTDGPEPTDMLALLVADYAARHGEEPSDEVLKEWKKTLGEAVGIDSRSGDENREEGVSVGLMGVSDSDKKFGIDDDDEDVNEDKDKSEEDHDERYDESDGLEPPDVLAVLVAEYAALHGEDPSDEVLKQWKSALSEAAGIDSGDFCIESSNVIVQGADSDKPKHVFSNITSTQSSISSLPGGAYAGVADSSNGESQPGNSLKHLGSENSLDVNAGLTAMAPPSKVLISHRASLVVEGLPENAIEYGGVYSRKNADTSGNAPDEWLSNHTGALGKPYRLYHSVQSGRWLLGWRQASTDDATHAAHKKVATGVLAPDVITGAKKKKNKRKSGAAKACSDVAHEGQALGLSAVEGSGSGVATSASTTTSNSGSTATAGQNGSLLPSNFTAVDINDDDDMCAGFRSEDCSAVAPELCFGGWHENAGAGRGGWVQAPELTVRVSTALDESPVKKQRGNGNGGPG